MYIGAEPLWAFRFLAARQGTRPTKVGLCLLGARTDKLGPLASGGLFAAGKDGDGGQSIPTEGSLGKAACWLGGSLGFDIERRPKEERGVSLTAVSDEGLCPSKKSSLQLDFQES